MKPEIVFRRMLKKREREIQEELWLIDKILAIEEPRIKSSKL